MERLDDLECHFTWITEEHLKVQNASKLLEYMTTDIKKDGNDVEVLARPFMSYLCAHLDKPDLDRALEESVKAIDLCRKYSTEPDCDRRRGYELVALSNKAHVQHALENNDGVVATLKEIEALKKMNDDNKTKASILGMQGFALSHVETICPESLVLFRQAEELDPDNFQWSLGRGLVAGRIFRWERRVNPNSSNLLQLDSEQEESLKRTCEMTDDKQHVALLHLADVYFWRGRGDSRFRWTQDRELLAKAKKLYLQVFNMRPDYPALLKRIGKAFPEIDQNEEPFAEECLLRAAELDPRNSMLLHRLGQFYEHSETKRDFRKTEAYYKDAVTSGISRNLAAEMDLGRVRRKINKEFDFHQYLIDLLDIYPNEDHQATIHNRLRHVKKTGERRI